MTQAATDGADQGKTEKADSRKAAMSKWARVTLLLLALILAGFGVRLIVNSQSVISSVNQRNFHDLAIAAEGLERWPDNIFLVAKSQFVAVNQPVPLDHPDLGSYEIAYRTCPADTKGGTARAGGSSNVFTPGLRAGERTLYAIEGRFDNGKSGQKTCYATTIPLDRFVNLRRAAPDFSHLLIVSADGRVVAQVGETVLPVHRLANFSVSEGIAAGLAKEIVKPGSSSTTPAAVTLADVRQAVDVDIAGNRYRAYVKPFSVREHERACPTAAAADAQSLCFAVGLMPAERLRAAWLSPPLVALVGFGLALVALVALLPLLRLLLIGSAESISPVEAIGVVLGLQATAAVATLAIFFTAEFLAERNAAGTRGTEIAKSLAESAEGELQEALGRVAKHRSFSGQTKPDGQECEAFKNGAQILCPKSGESRPFPSMEGLYYVDKDGFPAASLKQLVFHTKMPTKFQIGGRDYFRALRRGETIDAPAFGDSGAPPAAGYCDPVLADGKQGRLRYTLGQVRAQTDGTDKTAMAFRCRQSDGVEPVYLLASTVLTSLTRPVLPHPHKFLVADVSDPALPVVFHSNPAHAGSEKLVHQLDGAGQALADLRQLGQAGAGDGDPIAFTARYEGMMSGFAALPIKGTNWVLLSYFHHADVDEIAAFTASRAIVAWASIALIGIAVIVFVFLYREDSWRHIWPDEEDKQFYPGLTRAFLAAAGIGAVVMLAAFAGAIDADGAHVFAIAIWLFTLIAFYRRLSTRSPSAKPLTARTERNYHRLIMALLLCIAVIPAASFWNDARALSLAHQDSRVAGSARNQLADREKAMAGLQRAIGMTPAEGEQSRGALVKRKGAWNPDSVKSVEWSWPRSLVRDLWSWQSAPPRARVDHCQTKVRDWVFCQDDSQNGRIGITPHAADWGMGLSWLAVIALILFFAGALWTAASHGLRALMGFGIPLGAVQWPPLKLGTGDETGDRLTERTLLVAPQQVVRDYLGKDNPWTVDLAEVLLLEGDAKLTDYAVGKIYSDLRALDENKGQVRLIVSGIELVLRDPVRRQAALKFLECADKEVSKKTLKTMIVISELSPLERILDAFESEKHQDKSVETTREELRWSRLFHTYSTFIFSPILKVPEAGLRELIELAKPQGYAGGEEGLEAIHAFVHELRWLPGTVIDGALGHNGARKALSESESTTKDVFPLPDKAYQDAYQGPIIDRAFAIGPPTKAAAIDYLRANLIEFYEQCWAASTHGERLILDAIARGNFVNMRHALGLQTLVRRGLVILDPAPRLMNDSFAQFVRQAERPNTLVRWREEQPKSGWEAARLPILLFVPVAIVALAIAAAESGQELTAFWSLLAAGAPALLSTGFRLVRPA